LIAGCSIEVASGGPKYVPESTTLAGPELKIPTDFVGCWRGTVDQFDTVTSFTSSPIKAMSSIYEFCFTNRPDGTGKLELTDLEVADRKTTVTHFDNRIISVDPEHRSGSMRNHVTFVSVYYLIIHLTQDAYVDEDLRMTSRDEIFVKGKQVIVIGGNIIAEMTFHTNFYRVSAEEPADGTTDNVS